MDLITMLVPFATGAALGVFGDRLSLRREARQDRVSLAREAADQLLPALRHLRDMARDSTYDEHHPRAWSEAITSFTRVCDDFDHRLPDRWHHMRRSVRAALSQYAGGVVMSDLDTRLVHYPLPPRDHTWLTNAIEYLEYVVARVQVWKDTPLGADSRRRALLAFDPWLARRDTVPALL
jgi:hypothetical protein